MPASRPSSRCADLVNPNPYTVTLAAFILVGVLISYLPQHIKIIQRRSSQGLAPGWVLLGGMGSIAAIGNILVLPKSRRDMQCCSEISAGECAAALLGVGQIGLQWACFMFIVMLFLTFFPTATTATNNSSNNTSNASSSAPPRSRQALTVGVTLLVTILFVFLTSLAIVFTSSTPTAQTWADILGTTAAILSMVQWVPQIYFTWRLGSIASLSILTMIIQVPGAFMFAFSLWLRVGYEGWSTWMVFVITGCLQASLLGLAIYYYVIGRRKVVEEVQEEVIRPTDREDVDERTALLGNGSTSRKGSGPRSRSGEAITRDENVDPGGERAA